MKRLIALLLVTLMACPAFAEPAIVLRNEAAVNVLTDLELGRVCSEKLQLCDQGTEALKGQIGTLDSQLGLQLLQIDAYKIEVQEKQVFSDKLSEDLKKTKIELDTEKAKPGWWNGFGWGGAAGVVAGVLLIVLAGSASR